MTSDRQKQLEGFTVGELVGELQRRKAELDEALGLLALPGADKDEAKNPRMSEAKAAYWQEWHEYKAAYPHATVAGWRKSKAAVVTRTRKSK
jgi:hypothetical protein